MNRRFGLLGTEVSGSFSPAIHGLMSDDAYELYSLPPDRAKDFLRRAPFDGINVTMPYKLDVLPFLQEMSEKAKRCGNVNTVLRREDGTLYGDNTDDDGVCECLDRLRVDVKGKKVLVLGSGGASRTVQAVVRERGGLPIVISRRGEWNYTNYGQHGDAFGLINTTPVGSLADPLSCPVALDRLPKLGFVMDVLYSPLRTRLMQEAEKRSIPHIGGLPMLVRQAVEARRIFDGRPQPEGTVERVLEALLRQKTQLVLVGMPGSGKSTLAKLLSEKLSLSLCETDALVEQATGMRIPDLFAEQGEAAFRAMEKQALIRACRGDAQIIGTGGGCVLNAENRFFLRMNGFVVHIRRDIDALSMEGRPLSVSREALASMEKQRLPLYRDCADFEIVNHGMPEEAALAIAEAYEQSIRSKL